VIVKPYQPFVMRALAVSGRSEASPDVPTMRESVPGFEANTWQGIGAPKTRPPGAGADASKKRWKISSIKMAFSIWLARRGFGR
jgi:hypothetical protein